MHSIYIRGCGSRCDHREDMLNPFAAPFSYEHRHRSSSSPPLPPSLSMLPQPVLSYETTHGHQHYYCYYQSPLALLPTSVPVVHQYQYYHSNLLLPVTDEPDASIQRESVVGGREVRKIRRRTVWFPEGDKAKTFTASSSIVRPTTVMVRNIPNKYSRNMIMEWLDRHCEEENKNNKNSGLLSQYDFLYLPVDFGCKGSNLGYAFVNFTSSVGAMKLFNAMHGRGWEKFRSKKICHVCIAKIQGKEALMDHFRNKLFQFDSDEFLPIVFTPPRSGGRLANAAAADVTTLSVVGARRIAV